MTHSSSTWVGAGVDGRLEVFAVGTDHEGGQSLWHRWQTTSGNGWSDWCSHGTPPDANGLRWSPTVAPAADGCLEVFVVGDDLEPDGLGSGGALHRTSQTYRHGGWSRWRSYPTDGPNLFGSPAVVRNADGHLELFVLGDDGALWHMWQTAPKNGWSQWVSHGAPPGLLLNSAPSVAAGEDGRLDVFIVSQEAVLWRIGKTAANSGWSDWTSHGSPSGALFGSDSTPVVAYSADGHLELFVVGNDGRLWQMGQTVPNGGWSGWRPHEAPSGMKFLRLRPAVASGLDGPLELFVVGDDASLWHLRHTESNTARRDGFRMVLRRWPGWRDHRRSLPTPTAACSSLSWAPTEPCGSCRRQLPAADGRSGLRTAPQRGLPFLRRSPLVEGRLQGDSGGIYQGRMNLRNTTERTLCSPESLRGRNNLSRATARP